MHPAHLKTRVDISSGFPSVQYILLISIHWELRFFYLKHLFLKIEVRNVSRIFLTFDPVFDISHFLYSFVQAAGLGVQNALHARELGLLPTARVRTLDELVRVSFPHRAIMLELFLLFFDVTFFVDDYRLPAAYSILVKYVLMVIGLLHGWR
jgi:hypothetical protein